jgi:hypothetical protein
MVRIKCPSCAAVQEVADSLRGQVGKCRACHGALPIPRASQAPATIAPGPDPADPTHWTSSSSVGGPDNQIRPDRPGGEPRPLVVSLPNFAERDGPAIVKEPVDEAPPPPARKRGRRTRKGHKKRRGRNESGALGYFLGAISPFGWGLVGLAGVWLACIAFAFVSTVPGRLLLVLGACLLVVGNVWIAFIAYTDSQVFGLLCFCTCFFTYVYIVMNPDETWRPGALSGLGLLFSLSGIVVSHLSGAPA